MMMCGSGFTFAYTVIACSIVCPALQLYLRCSLVHTGTLGRSRAAHFLAELSEATTDSTSAFGHKIRAWAPRPACHGAKVVCARSVHIHYSWPAAAAAMARGRLSSPLIYGAPICGIQGPATHVNRSCVTRPRCRPRLPLLSAIVRARPRAGRGAAKSIAHRSGRS